MLTSTAYKNFENNKLRKKEEQENEKQLRKAKRLEKKKNVQKKSKIETTQSQKTHIRNLFKGLFFILNFSSCDHFTISGTVENKEGCENNKSKNKIKVLSDIDVSHLTLFPAGKI